jgi:hypothetical protein
MVGLTSCPTSVRLDRIDSQQRTLALECYQGPVIDGSVSMAQLEGKVQNQKVFLLSIFTTGTTMR